MPASAVRAAPGGVRRLYVLSALLVLSAAGCDGAPLSPPVPERMVASSSMMSAPELVISQVYGAGGNAGAPLSHDYVELFNPGTQPVSVAGWSVQYASANGTTWSVTALAAATVPAGGYYLVRMAAGANAASPLPTPDATGTTAMSGSDAKVILARTTTALTGSCPTDANVVDRVSYGTTSCGATWGSTASLSATLAAVRNSGGCAYTGNVTTDFTRAAPAPRNSASPVNVCGVVQPQPDSVAVAPATATMQVGATQSFTASAFAAGVPTGTTFRWSSSDVAVATVDSITGQASGVGVGSATITVRAANGVSASAALTVTPAPQVSGDVVISQVYGAGGNSGATFTHDYVELFNRGTVPVDINGWSVQYSSANGTTWQASMIGSGSSIMLAPGAYFLVRLGSGANGVALPVSADATGGLNLSGTAGKVALSSSAAALTGACPTGGSVADRLAYGSTNCGTDWGSVSVLSASTAALRAGYGCVDTGSGSADFTVGAPAPRNSASLRNPCAGPASLSVAPASAAVDAGASQAFTANALDGSGQAIFAAVLWTSSNPAVATVDGTSGIATGVSAGTAVITATATNGITSTATLTVNVPLPATGLVISEFLSDPDGSDTSGEWFEVYNRGPDALDLQGWTIQSNSSTGTELHVIASSVPVPAGGFAVFGNNGSAATNGGVDVAYSYGSSIILNNSNTDWLVLRRPDGTTEDSVAYSARNASGAIVSPLYTPTAATARVLVNELQDNTVAGAANWQNATASYGDGRNRGTPGIGAYGTPGPVTKVVVAPATASALIGTTAAFSAVAVDALGRIAAGALAWSSSNPAIASVDPVTGVATGVSEGSVQVQATAPSGVVGTATFNVVHPDAPASVSISANDPLWLPVGYQKRLFVTVRSWAGATLPPDLTWSVSDPALGSVVVQDGRFYFASSSAGTAVITGRAINGVTGTVTLNVLPADAPTSAVYRNHLEFGTPLDADASDDVLVTKPGFVASYNPLRGGPNWVSWNLNASHFGAAERCDCFSPDLTLPASVPQVIDPDYINGGYDRGHMVQSESRTSTEQENAATFLFTNILPQAAANNQGSWLNFENHLNDLARQQAKEIYVVAGGEYAAAPPTLKDAGKVAIPDFTWKIAVVLPGGQGLGNVTSAASAQVLAVRMPNLLSTAANAAWTSYAATVDQIEAATGYDFLAELPDWIERIVEANDRYPTASATAPAPSLEGTAVTFSGSGSDPDAGDVLSYRWEFGDGNHAATPNATHTYADDGTYSARFIVTDAYGAADTVLVNVTVGNVAPAPAALAPAALLLGEVYDLAGSFTDPGEDSWTAGIAFGDGATATASTATRSYAASHTYAMAGTYTVTVTITDDEGGSGTVTTTVTVSTASQGLVQLMAQVDALVDADRLSRGNGTALLATVTAALRQLERAGPGSETAAIEQVDAFLLQLRALEKAGVLLPADAASLRAYAQRVRSSI